MKKFLIILLPFFLFCGCSNVEKAQSYYLDAVSEYKNQDFERALMQVNKAIGEKSDFYQAQFLKAKILFFSKDFQNAENIFLKLTKEKQDNFDCKYWLLRCYLFQNKLDDAIIYINKLILSNTEDWRLYYYKAQIAKQQNNFEEYFSNLNTAEKFLKDSQVVYLDLGLIWHEFGLSERSSAYYSKAEILKK